MSVCVYFVFVPSCVQVAALQRADPPYKESYRLCKRSRNRKSSQGEKRAVEPKTENKKQLLLGKDSNHKAESHSKLKNDL
jgi:hypothetical protein